MLWIVVVLSFAYVGWVIWNYVRVKRSAKFLPNEAFRQLIPSAQLIDLRDSQSFKRGHILGARNFPARDFTVYLSALRKDKPILLYDSSRATALAKVVIQLKKAGFHDIFILKDGIDYWDGKIKSNG